MKALVLHGKRDLRLEDVPEPTTPPGWVKLRVKEVGICGTDKAFYEG
ncbi:MAG: alcohol dehydrogenase, partial [Desulfurococcales archaeon]|nr:alcohol dehydrogenase [Desulfurococcales archaeon]